MKCDELQQVENPIEWGLYYDKSEVDDAITELKAENKKLKASSEQIMNELFDKVLIYPHEMVSLEDAYKLAVSLKNTKRALWLARAERAHSIILLWNVYCYQNNSLYYRDFLNIKCNPFRNLTKKTAMEWSDLWKSIETKLRVKAEEYK